MNANAAQPGTWLYDRANWCPGEAVHVFQNELTPYVTPGDSVVINVDMQSFTNLDLSHGAGYQIDGQLITYGAPNFTLDAELREMFRRAMFIMFTVTIPFAIPHHHHQKRRHHATYFVVDHVWSNGRACEHFHWNGTLNFLKRTPCFFQR